MKDQKLWEKKKEIEKEDLKKRYREWEESVRQYDKFFPRLLSKRKSCIYLRQSLGNVFSYYKVLEIPPLEVSGSLEDKLDMLPEIRINDAVRDLQGDLLLENEIGSIRRETDDLGDLFHISKALECPDCQEEKKEFRLNSEKDWICYSCYKVRIVAENLETRLGKS